MIRIFGRLVLALLFFVVFAVVIWVWMARGCLALDPTSGWHPAANCADKSGTARLAWFLSFFSLIVWAVQPRKGL